MQARTIIVAVVAVLLAAGAAQAALINIDTVTVGNPGNAADSTGYGAVAYEYNIGKYEVTAGQYTAFLNAVATVTDTYALYNTDMSNTSYGSGITRSVVSGGYSYSVATNFVNRPVNYVSFWDSCRFANWLSNGQSGAGTTETGTYTLTPTGIANNTITRNANATWSVASEDEWYKAAYYKGGSTNAGYWTYPTRSNTAPGRDMTEATNPGNNANYYTDSGAYPIDSGKYTTVAGEFQLSDSPYGTFDQGGNVWEWNEAILYSSDRGLRGGAYYSSGGGYSLASSSRNGFNPPSTESDIIGFRVASEIPEPATLSLLALGGLAMLRRQKQR